jgi:hypothetical protein
MEFFSIIKYYAKKMYGGEEVQIHVFMTSELVGGRLSLRNEYQESPWR